MKSVGERERDGGRGKRARVKRSSQRKRVLARLKEPGRPLKTIRLMKYVKAHKETLRPFRKGGGKYTASAKMEKNRQKPRQYTLAKTSSGEEMKI